MNVNLIQNDYNEPNFHYNEIPNQTNLNIKGYFQSEKYFKNAINEIRYYFLFKLEILTKITSKWDNILNKDVCSIHVRRGDYLLHPNHHPFPGISYYENACKYFPNSHFLIFSDDINWCKDNFHFISNKTFVENQNEIEDLLLMSFCNDNIIANSSFSWWGSYLNSNENKKIISPKQWFGSAYKNMNTEDLYTDKMIKI